MLKFHLPALPLLHRKGDDAILGARRRRRRNEPVWSIDRQEILRDLYYGVGR